MGETGEKGVLMGPVSWEEHFQALRSAVADTFKGKAGHLVAVHLLGMVREMAELFPILMEDEDHRDFYLRQIGTPWLITRRPCPWDFETMRPVLLDTVSSSEIKEEDELVVVDGWGPRPTNTEETLTFMALSKGLVWVVDKDREENMPAVLCGVQGVAPFPIEPMDLPKELPFTTAELALADDLAKGTVLDYTSVFNQNSREEGGPMRDLLEQSTHFWMALPRAVAVGGGFPVFTPIPGALFEDYLAQLLGVDSGAWPDLRLQGETQGTPWELHFSVICRGLELDPEEKEAKWVFDITPLWAGGIDAKRLAHGWTPQEWDAWRENVVGAVDQAQERLRGATPLQAHAVAVTKGVAALGNVGEVRTISPAPLETIRNISWGSWEARTSHLAQTQLKHLMTGNTSKIKRLPTLEEDRIQEGIKLMETTGTKPDWLKQARGKGIGWELVKEERGRLRGMLLDDRYGFFELGQGGAAQWVKGFPLENGETLELQIGGQGVQYMNQRDLKEMQTALRKEEVTLEKEIKGLEETMGKTLFKADVQDELGRKQKRMGKLQDFQENLTSWKMAMDLLKHLVDEVAVQPRNPIEVEAQAIKDWMWPGKEAPDNWLQVVVETLKMLAFHYSAAAVVGGRRIEAGSFIQVSTQRKDAPGQDLTQDEAKGLKGGNLVYIIRINPALLGGITLRKTGTRTLTSGVEADVFEGGKLTRAQTKARKDAGDRDIFREAHLAVILKALGYDEVETTLAEHINAYMTKAGANMAGKWTTKPKGGKYEDGSIDRRYTSDFQGCQLLPPPGGDAYFLGALGSFEKAPEQGWDMAGKPTPSMHKGGLLHHMGLHLPPGPSGPPSQAIYRKGLQALRRVVVELGGGLLAVRMPDGTWHDLGDTTAEPVALYRLQTGKVFPFLAPGWVAKAKAAYQEKEGVVFPEGIRQADETRWTTRPSTPQDTLDGVPIHILLAAAVAAPPKMTQDQAAKELGVSPMTISRWIRGAKPISPESAPKVLAWIEGRGELTRQFTLTPPE